MVARLVLICFALFGCVVVSGNQDCNTNLDAWLDCNNPPVIAYLNSLRVSDIGKSLKGVVLSDNTLALAGLTFLGQVNKVPSGVHLFLFKQGEHPVAYLWVEKDAKEFELPTCEEWGPPGSAHVLSGDVYTWDAAQPAHGVIQVDCVAKLWE